MSRTRYVRPEFFKDEDLAELTHWIRLLFIGLWVIADKAGRLKDRPLWIKAELFPYENIDIEKGLKALASPKKYGKLPLIYRYEADNAKYIQILGWTEHQKPHHQEPESRILKIPKELLKTLTLTKTITINIREQVEPHQRISEPIQRNSEHKIKYLDFVMLYKEEYDKLIANLGKLSTNKLIEDLNNYIGSKGKKYKSHYHTILTWSKKSQDGLQKWLDS